MQFPTNHSYRPGVRERKFLRVPRQSRPFQSSIVKPPFPACFGFRDGWESKRAHDMHQKLSKIEAAHLLILRDLMGKMLWRHNGLVMMRKDSLKLLSELGFPRLDKKDADWVLEHPQVILSVLFGMTVVRPRSSSDYLVFKSTGDKIGDVTCANPGLIDLLCVARVAELAS